LCEYPDWLASYRTRKKEEEMKMEKRTLVVTVIVGLALAIAYVAHADIPLMINHQGLVKVDGGPFTGNGQFKFGLIDSAGNWLWTNDGTHVGETASSTTPDQAVVVSVSYGVYNVQLGDTSISNMVEIPSSVFDSDDVDLRVIFNDQVLGWETLLPDQRITSGAYAYHAARADYALNALPSIFGVFCGDSSDGDVTVLDHTSFSFLTGSADDWYLQADDFTIDSGATVTVDTSWAYIAVRGTCTIHGTIDADGQGEAGGARSETDGYVGANAYGNGGGTAASSASSEHEYARGVFFALSGAGGGGGAYTGDWYGGAGGGAGGAGGAGAPSTGDRGSNGTPMSATRKILTGGGLGDNSTHGFSHFQGLLLLRGAGGGSGAGCASSHPPDYSGAGGRGGGVIYIECDRLVFDGVLTANGADGVPGYADAASGGGGGGGVIIVKAKTVVTNEGTVSVAGGTGGTTSYNRNGGDGADGFKDIIQVK